jgi:hypothetical protein
MTSSHPHAAPCQWFSWLAAALDEAIRRGPELAEEFAWLKIAALCNGGDVESGLEPGAELFKIHKDGLKALNDCFCNVLNPKLRDEPDPRVVRLALEAARRAVELSQGENAAYSTPWQRLNIAPATVSQPWRPRRGR